MNSRESHSTTGGWINVTLGLVIGACHIAATPSHAQVSLSTSYPTARTENTVHWDLARVRELYRHNSPIRIVQVVDTNNQRLIAGKPTVVRAYVCAEDVQGKMSSSLTADLFVDGKLVESNGGCGGPLQWTVDFCTRGTLIPTAGQHNVEVQIRQGDEVLLKDLVQVTFHVPRRKLVLVTVPVHVRGLFGTRKPSADAIARAHAFAAAVFPLATLEVIREQKPFIVSSGTCRGHGAGGRQQRTALATSLARNGISRAVRQRMAEERAQGNIAVIVGITPDIGRIFGGRSNENIHGFAVPFVGACLVKSDHHMELTVAHEVGHLMPAPLHDSYRTMRSRGGEYAKSEPTEHGLTSQSSGGDQDDAGVFISEAMGGYNIAYQNSAFPELAKGQPIVSGAGRRNRTPIRGFMGAYGAMWATTSEYARLYDCLVGPAS